MCTSKAQIDYTYPVSSIRVEPLLSLDRAKQSKLINKSAKYNAFGCTVHIDSNMTEMYKKQILKQYNIVHRGYQETARADRA